MVTKSKQTHGNTPNSPTRGNYDSDGRLQFAFIVVRAGQFATLSLSLAGMLPMVTAESSSKRRRAPLHPPAALTPLHDLLQHIQAARKNEIMLTVRTTRLSFARLRSTASRSLV